MTENEALLGGSIAIWMPPEQHPANVASNILIMMRKEGLSSTLIHRTQLIRETKGLSTHRHFRQSNGKVVTLGVTGHSTPEWSQAACLLRVSRDSDRIFGGQEHATGGRFLLWE